MNKKFQALNKSVLHQIESVLRDKKRLVDRTRTKRTEYPVIGEKLYNGRRRQIHTMKKFLMIWTTIKKC